ncbi:hypothetical protein BN940_13026 [Castellaniella defragrans 65Phen]|uniref:Uncharacterized protein n=1 Tax=Castellaniella defragrans (strain DSM 12143 / CCUG 39792 / 65Phen) TaxID=1437824 RepID=W8X9L9_CASD6|nr:hypothetical protein BN940_13026 [Castellaniella defragrans 65Phen]
MPARVRTGPRGPHHPHHPLHPRITRIARSIDYFHGRNLKETLT